MSQTVKIHKLKTWPEYFQDVASGNKNFEFRKNDRDFGVGDIVVLEEWSPTLEEYSGSYIEARITYVLEGVLNLPSGWCILALDEIIVREVKYQRNLFKEWTGELDE